MQLKLRQLKLFEIYNQTRNRSLPLATLVRNSMTHWLTNSCLENLLLWHWRVMMPTQYLLRLLLLLTFILRNVLMTVWCRFGDWSLFIKLDFCSDFEHKVCSRFWKFGHYFYWRCFVGVKKLNLGRDPEAWSGQNFEV